MYGKVPLPTCVPCGRRKQRRFGRSVYELRRIISIARHAHGVKVIVSTSEGQAVFETEIDEDTVAKLVGGSHRVDAQAKAIISNAPDYTSG